MEPSKENSDTKAGIRINLPPELPEFPIEEFNGIARSLDIHNSIFSKMWQLGVPSFSNEIPTAGVFFDRVGKCIDFKINPTFWGTLTNIQKRFVISHECLHVILFHGIRTCKLKEQKDLANANAALDIIVNHALVDRFGFARVHFDPKPSKYYWVDTAFPENTPKRGASFEFYYNRLKKENPNGNGEGKGKGSAGGNSGNGGDAGKSDILDDHSGLNEFVSNEFNKLLEDNLSEQEFESMKKFVEPLVQDIKDDIQKELDKKESESGSGSNQGGKEAGNSPGFVWAKANIKKIIPKKKWETVIRKWSRKFMGEKEHDQWTHKNRRLQLISDDFMIPSDREVDLFKKDRILVWFFQDTSGSCSSFMQRFFDCARSLPKDRFDVKMHCFDTEVYEVSLEDGKLKGFGGTSFSCIEKYIQGYIKTNKCKYPEAVFMITDGEGDTVKPEKPENWYWFLDGTDRYVPAKSKKFNLMDFE